jgi:hypothetical protein
MAQRYSLTPRQSTGVGARVETKYLHIWHNQDEDEVAKGVSEADISTKCSRAPTTLNKQMYLRYRCVRRQSWDQKCGLWVEENVVDNQPRKELKP